MFLHCGLSTNLNPVHGLFCEHVGQFHAVDGDVVPRLVVELVGNHRYHLPVDFTFLWCFRFHISRY